MGTRRYLELFISASLDDTVPQSALTYSSQPTYLSVGAGSKCLGSSYYNEDGGEQALLYLLIEPVSGSLTLARGICSFNKSYFNEIMASDVPFGERRRASGPELGHVDGLARRVLETAGTPPWTDCPSPEAFSDTSWCPDCPL